MPLHPPKDHVFVSDLPLKARISNTVPTDDTLQFRVRSLAVVVHEGEIVWSVRFFSWTSAMHHQNMHAGREIS